MSAPRSASPTPSAAAPRLVATCWTSAGTAVPGAAPELSPFDALERVRVAAEEGWAGIGFGQDDLRRVRETIGFAALRERIEEAGLEHVEVELCSGWWEEDVAWRETWELLLDAAEALGAAFVKAGTAFGEPVADVGPLVGPFRRLAEEAAARGTRVALEPLPFAMVASVPQGAELVHRAGIRRAGSSSTSGTSSGPARRWPSWSAASRRGTCSASSSATPTPNPPRARPSSRTPGTTGG